MQCALPNPYIYFFVFLGGHYPCDSFQPLMKICINCIYNVQKLFAGEGEGAKMEGARRENGGNSAIVVGGIDLLPDHSI